jgi:hypothetical protein
MGNLRRREMSREPSEQLRDAQDIEHELYLNSREFLLDQDDEESEDE